MNLEIRFPTKTQRHKDGHYLRQITGVTHYRSLKPPSPQLRFVPLRLCVKRLLLGSLLFMVTLIGSTYVAAQEVADTVRVNTRVVFMDALVKEKRTGIPISDLKPENFQVLDDGKPRPISYFTRDGQARKPLALLLVLDLREDGAGRFLKRPEILDAMAAELAKLSPEDEVAIIATNYNEDSDRQMLTDFTRDRAQIAAALKKVPSLMVSEDEKVAEMIKASGPDQPDSEATSDRIQVDKSGADQRPVSSQVEINKPAETETPNQDVVSIETQKDPKTGATVTRTIMKNGTVAARRTDKNGNINVSLGEEYSLYAAAREISLVATQQRPNSRASIIWLTDGITPIIFEDRKASEDLLIRSNVTFNSLTVSMRTLYRFLLPIAKPVGNWIGMSFAGSAKYLAKQTGGEAVQVSRTSDYSRALSKIIGNLTARYSLGFTLAEEEKDDGRLHALEVRVKAPDAKGKLRKIEVSSRQGYYMSTATQKEATASTAQ